MRGQRRNERRNERRNGRTRTRTRTRTRSRTRTLARALARSQAGPRDRGQVAIEYLGFVPILLLVALAGVQVGLIAYTAQQAGTAARAGARAASLRQDAGRACTGAVSDWLAGGTRCATAELGDSVEVTATVHIPTVVFGWNFGDTRKSAVMPLDH